MEVDYCFIEDIVMSVTIRSEQAGCLYSGRRGSVKYEICLIKVIGCFHTCHFVIIFLINSFYSVMSLGWGGGGRMGETSWLMAVKMYITLEGC